MSTHKRKDESSEEDEISILSIDIEADKSVALARAAGMPVQEWNPAMALRISILGFLLTPVHGGEPSVDNPTFAHLIQRGVLAKWPRRSDREPLGHERLREFRDESKQSHLPSRILSFTGPVEYTESTHNPLSEWRAPAKGKGRNNNNRAGPEQSSMTEEHIQKMIASAIAASLGKPSKKRKAAVIEEEPEDEDEETPKPSPKKRKTGGSKTTKKSPAKKK